MKFKMLTFCLWTAWLAGACHSSSYVDGNDSDVENQIDSTTDLQLPAAIAEMEWTVLEPATFTVGSPDTEWGRYNDELQHQVEHTHRYEMATKEVTCEQWNDLSHPSNSYACDASGCEGDNCPIEIWDVELAKDWLDALSEASGLAPCYAEDANWETPLHCPGYRFPTESEWERAARGEDERATYGGDFNGYEEGEPDNLSSIAWCGHQYMYEEDEHPMPTGERIPNDLGMFDMIGNVAEVTTWDGNYLSNPPPSPYGNTEEMIYVYRGGNYLSHASAYRRCRAASRAFDDPTQNEQRNGIGFRPVRTLEGGTLPSAQEMNWCPAEGTVTECTRSIHSPLVNAFPAEGDAVYVDMHSNTSNTVAILGKSETEGVFTQELRAWSDVKLLPETPLFLSNSTHLTPLLIRQLSGNQTYTILCDGDTCALYQVDAEFSMVIFEGGEIPSWIGEPTDVELFEEPFELYVSGNGIAKFDGESWHEAVAPQDTARYAAMARLPSDEDTLVAVGTNGVIIEKQNDTWQPMASVTTENLIDVTLAPIGTTAFELTDYELHVIGENGVFLVGPSSQFSTCHLNDEQFSALVPDSPLVAYTEPSEGVHTIVASNRLIRYDYSYHRETACHTSDIPSDVIALQSFYCDAAYNEVFLTPTGLMTGSTGETDFPFLCITGGK